MKKKPAFGKVSDMLKNPLILLGLISLASTGWSQDGIPRLTPSILSTSPDGKFQVRREQATSGDLGEARKSVAICTADGKILYEWVSGLGTTTVLWSPDRRFVAINDMPGEKGDLLRLFALDATIPSVLPLRDPDGKKLRQEVDTRHGSFLSRVDTVTLRASEWKEGKLWCQVTGTFSPKRQPSVHVPFHHLWVLKTDGKNAPVIEQEWTLTDPREKPYRDEGH